MNYSGPFAGLSTRARNVLDRLGVRSVAQLRQTTDLDLLKARSCGLVTLREIRDWLSNQSPDDDFTPGGKKSTSDSAVEDLRRKILAAIGDTSPYVRAADIDTLIAEFADGLLDREREIWQKELVAVRTVGDTPPRNGPGELHVGANDKGEVVTADDLHRFEGVVRARVAAAVRSALASARKKQTATTSKGKP